VNTPQPPRLTPAQAEALQARFALKISARLDEGAKALPHDISERLRVARQTAVAAALVRPAVQTAPQTAPSLVAGVVLAGAGGGASVNVGGLFAGAASSIRGHSRDVDHGRRLDDAPPSWGWRIASALPLIVLLAGLWGITAWYQREQVQAAAEVDVALLSDELPPAAYADPGFEEYLRSQGADAHDQPALQDTSEVNSRIDTAVSELPVPAPAQGSRP
jgi:hypothetical protein